MTTRKDHGDDARALLRAAMHDRREPLTAIASLPDLLSVEPWYFSAWENSRDDGSTAPVFWLPCQGAVDVPDFSRRMEAAELFALLAQVDYALWRELATEFWPEDAQWADFFETRSALRVGLAIEVFSGVDGIERVWLYNSMQDIIDTNTNYRETRARMVAVAGAESAPFVPVRIDHFAHDESYVALVSDIQRELPNDSDRALRFTQLKIDPGIHRANEEAIGSLESIRARGIQVMDLPVVNFPLGDSNIVDYLKSLASLLDADTPADTPRVSPTGGVEKIVIDRSLQAEMAPSVLSTIHNSCSLRAVQFDMDQFEGDEQESEEDVAKDPARKRLMYWTALALFRRKIPLALVEIRVSSIFMKDVEWIEQVLTASDPMALLYPEESDSAGPRVAQTCRAVLYDPHDRKNALKQKSWVVREPMEVDILGDSSRDGFIPVLLPSWGKAWIREEKATIVMKTEETCAPAITPPGHLIIRDMTETTMIAVLRLLKIIGQGIRRLEIDDCDCGDAVMTIFCAQVLVSCPNLEELELCRMELSNFHFLHNSFRLHRCPALQKLTLWEIQLREQDAVEQLLTCLGTPRHRMAVQLRKLRLAPSHVVDAAIRDTTFRTLSTNTRLRDVALAFRVDEDSREPYEASFHPLRRSTVSEPLPSHCICAFISVASTSRVVSGGPAHNAMTQFDSRVFNLILAFAASPRTRSVTFTAMTPRLLE